MENQTGSFGFINDGVSAEHELNVYLNFLSFNRNQPMVGAPTKPLVFEAFSLITA